MATTTSLLLFHPTPLHPTQKRPKYPSLSLPKPSFPLRSSPFVFPLRLPLRQNNKHIAYISPLPSVPFHLPSPTPLSLTKLSLALALALALTLAKLLLNPFFWTHLSIFLPFYPYLLSLLLALIGTRSFLKHVRGRSTLVDQILVITSAITWLTLVPAAHANGFLEGYPVLFFFVYHYFLLFEPSVRSRLYGDLLPRAHPARAHPHPHPLHARVSFSLLVLAGHFLAAHEGPELHLVPGGWANAPVLALVFLTVFARYHSVLYLAKYMEKTAVPTAVVQFGPYRWVRHPIYATNIMLLAAYCCALRAPMSLGFLVAACLWYYGGKAEAEEREMVEEFGDRYTEYALKVRYRLIPLLY